MRRWWRRPSSALPTPSALGCASPPSGAAGASSACLGAFRPVEQLRHAPEFRRACPHHADLLGHPDRGPVVGVDQRHHRGKSGRAEGAGQRRLGRHALPPAGLSPHRLQQPRAVPPLMAQDACGSGRTFDDVPPHLLACGTGSSGPPMNRRTAGSASMATIASRSASVRARAGGARCG